MVFEADRDSLRSKLVAANDSAAKLDLDLLIAKVEARYSTLTNQQKRQWEDTRAELAHIKEHLDTIVTGIDPDGNSIALTSRGSQRANCIQLTDRITVI